jgi:hypothetical protein
MTPSVPHVAQPETSLHPSSSLLAHSAVALGTQKLQISQMPPVWAAKLHMGWICVHTEGWAGVANVSTQGQVHVPCCGACMPALAAEWSVKGRTCALKACLTEMVRMRTCARFCMSHKIISWFAYTTSSVLSGWLPAPKLQARASANWPLSTGPARHTRHTGARSAPHTQPCALGDNIVLRLRCCQPAI